MKITAVCMGHAQRLSGLNYKTGIDKSPISGPVMVDSEGLVGDAICNRKHHGGVDQAIYLEGGETMAWWATELGREMPPGIFGENLVIDGVDNRDLVAGDRFQIGDIILEVTSARIPCNTFAARMRDKTFARLYSKAARPGAYCRVIAGGFVESGMEVSLQPYRGDRIGLPELMVNFGRKLEGEARARYLAAPVHYKIKALIA